MVKIKTASDLAATRTDWGKHTTFVLGIDPGAHGGIVAGSSIDDCKAIPYPQDDLEYRDFSRTLYTTHGIDPLCCSLYYERRPVTDKVPGGAARIYQMGLDDGRWSIIAITFADKGALYPQSWRRIAFPTLDGKPNGSMAWKILEQRYCRFFTGDRLIKNDKEYKSDNKVFGISAAFCIWLAGMKIQGKIDIESEVNRRKGL